MSDPLFDQDDPSDVAELVRLSIENGEREAKLWGRLLLDKQFLQSRGFSLVKRGNRIICDDRPISRQQLVMKADRERRLLTNGYSVTI